MNIQIRRVEYQDVEALRELYRQEANCQLIHDSALSRGLADPFLILIEGRAAGYGATWNKYYEGRLMEFYALPNFRPLALQMFRELLAASQSTHVEAQTNVPLMLSMLYDCARDIVAENILFHDAFVSDLPCPAGCFRRAKSDDHGAKGDWLIEADGVIMAAGGFLCHYNPPYGDIYMEVVESARRRGFGSYLVQELKRACCESGKKPAARCNPSNIASRLTLQKAGLLPCGHLLAGTVKPLSPGSV